MEECHFPSCLSFFVASLFSLGVAHTKDRLCIFHYFFFYPPFEGKDRMANVPFLVPLLFRIPPGFVLEVTRAKLASLLLLRIRWAAPTPYLQTFRTPHHGCRRRRLRRLCDPFPPLTLQDYKPPALFPLIFPLLCSKQPGGGGDGNPRFLFCPPSNVRLSSRLSK